MPYLCSVLVVPSLRHLAAVLRAGQKLPWCRSCSSWSELPTSIFADFVLVCKPVDQLIGLLT
jgi:hypothetical protein